MESGIVANELASRTESREWELTSEKDDIARFLPRNRLWPPQCEQPLRIRTSGRIASYNSCSGYNVHCSSLRPLIGTLAAGTLRSRQFPPPFRDNSASFKRT